jgi:tRNA-2-methylthio-N6-dimethylallyladenosine synthase
MGRSPWNQSVYVDGNERLLGEIVDVKITAGFDNSLTGTIETTEQEGLVTQ